MKRGDVEHHGIEVVGNVVRNEDQLRYGTVDARIVGPLPEAMMGNKSPLIFFTVDRWKIDHQMTDAALDDEVHRLDVDVGRILR